MIDKSFFTTVFDAVLALSGWEVVAASLGIAYILLATKESQWCWPMAFISTLIYTVLFWEGQLPMQALLNLYYMAMAIYGFLLWRQHGSDKGSTLSISKFTWYQQLLFLLFGSGVTFLVANYLQSIDGSQRPYLDAGVMVFSMLNTYLMARKILQNWLYWIVIDVAAIMLYSQTGFYATVALFSVYVVLAFIGYGKWMKHYYQQQYSEA